MILDANCRVLLSILGAAASTVSWRGAAIKALMQLGSVQAFRMNDTALTIRADAIEMLGMLAWHAPTGTADRPFQTESNASLIVNAMARGAVKEPNVMLQLRLSTMLRNSLRMDGLDREQKDGVLETLFTLSARSENEELCINTAVFYLGGARTLNTQWIFSNLLSIWRPVPLPKFAAHHCVSLSTFHFRNRVLRDICSTRRICWITLISLYLSGPTWTVALL
jgi:hypothetical protein